MKRRSFASRLCLVPLLLAVSCASDDPPSQIEGDSVADAAADDSTQTTDGDTGTPGDAGMSEDTAGAGDADAAQPPEDTALTDATDVTDAVATDADAGTDTTAWPATAEFPAGFLFGTAVAGFQVDMGCPTLPAAACDDSHSDWYDFVMSEETTGSAGAYLSGHPVSVGPGMWELYEQDFERAKTELGNNALRLSIEWSRVFPTATDGIFGHEALSAIANQDALATYHAMIAALRARGLEPLVTVNHYTLPSWLHDAVGCHLNLDTCTKRGWLDQDRAVTEIAKYAGFLGKEFGGEVDLWVTENEPLAVVLPGYLMPSGERTNPPAVQLRAVEARAVVGALIVAHARMYDALKAADTVDANADGVVAQVGLVYAMAPVKPMNPDNPLDVKGAENTFYLWNTAFLNAVVGGVFDEDLDGEGVHREDLANRMDFLGINYYTRITVEGSEASALPAFSPLLTINPFTLVPWEDYPRGLYEMAKLTHDTWGIPMIITENGTQDPNDDGTTPRFLVEHLWWLTRAIHEGADVRGYFYWTLLDNYEWNHGMDIRMGLYAVDKDDPAKKRTARKAVGTYHSIATTGAIPADLLEKYPVD